MGQKIHRIKISPTRTGGKKGEKNFLQAKIPALRYYIRRHNIVVSIHTISPGNPDDPGGPGGPGVP